METGLSTVTGFASQLDISSIDQQRQSDSYKNLCFFKGGSILTILYLLYFKKTSDRIQTDEAALVFFTGNPPLLLLPENVRIRKYNLSSEKFSDYLEGEERIQAVDYDWDPEGIGLSKYEL